MVVAFIGVGGTGVNELLKCVLAVLAGRMRRLSYA